MIQGIDFLQAYKKSVSKEAPYLKFLNLGSLVVLVAYCLLVGAIFSYWIYLRQESQNISSQIAIKKQKVKEFEKIELLQIVLKERLSLLNNLFLEKRSDYFQLLTYFQGVSPEGVGIEKITLSENGEGTLEGKADNAQALSAFLENLTPVTNTTPLSEVVLSSSTREKDGSYKFSLSIKTNGRT